MGNVASESGRRWRIFTETGISKWRKSFIAGGGILGFRNNLGLDGGFGGGGGACMPVTLAGVEVEGDILVVWLRIVEHGNGGCNWGFL